VKCAEPFYQLFWHFSGIVRATSLHMSRKLDCNEDFKKSMLDWRDFNHLHYHLLRCCVTDDGRSQSYIYSQRWWAGQRWCHTARCKGSLLPRPHLSQGKRSGEPSRISLAYYRNVVRTNEIATLLLITKNTLYSQAAMRKGARLFSTFSFWLDKWMLHCGDKCWNDFLHLII